MTAWNNEAFSPEALQDTPEPEVQTFHGSLEELNRSLSRFGEQLQAWLKRIMPFAQAMLSEFYAAFFPKRHKRMMLRAARRRTRLSTQVRRKRKRVTPAI